MAVLTPQPKMQFTTAAGVPLSGGKVYTYIAGTTTPQATFTDYTGSTPNTNPVILNSRGEANIWLGGALYKFKLTDANDVEIWTVDYISAPTSAVSPVLSGNVTIDSDTPGPALKITQTGTGPVLRVQDSADPDATPFIIDTNGNVGLGTLIPAASGVSPFLAIGADNAGIGSVSANNIVLVTNNDERMRIDASGNVGIGTTSPSERLQVNVQDGVRLGSSGNVSYARIGSAVTGETTAEISYARATGSTIFSQGNTGSALTERARITSDGNLLVGTTSESLGGTTSRLNVQIQNTSTRGIAIQNGGVGTSTAIVFVNSVGVGCGFINVSDSSTAYNTSSDYRLKHDVQPLAGGLAVIAALKPSTYKWNADNSLGEGFIAHELATVIPHAVTGEKDAVNEDGSIKPQGVDYSKVVVHLVAAVQELAAKLEAAEARIATLEAR